jgi:zinc protease
MQTRKAPPFSGDHQTDRGLQAQLHTLSNGLRVVLLEDHSAPVVALQTWVRFGSADEDPAVAGIAHVFEHMLFKGTERFPHGEIAALIEGAGGVVNAWTSYDETVYHVTIASRFWEIGFDVLSDAVLHSLFDATELAREKEVVLEELRRGKDNPDRELSEQQFALAFTTHPYRRPVIGYEETVTKISREDMLQVFHTWYVPNNMIFVAVGDFETQVLMQTVAARFGAVTARTLPTRPRPEEPLQTAPRALAFAFQAELARVEIAFPSVAVTDPHVPVLDLLSDVLGAGYNSVLYTALKRRRGLAHEVYAYNYTPLDRGILVVGASCTPERIAEVVRSLMQQVCNPALPLTDHALAAAKTRIVSHFVHARETYQGIADQLGRFTMAYGDPNYSTHYVAAIEALGLEDLHQAAATFLTLQRANIALLVPPGMTPPDERTVLSWAQEKRARTLHPPSSVFRSSGVSTLVLPWGSKLIVQTDHKTPLVSIRTICDGGQRAEPPGKEGLAHLFASVWDRGTELRSAAEIERDIDRLGGVLSAASDRDTVQLGARFLKETLAEGLEIYFDILADPAFPEEEVARERADQLRELDSLKEHRFNFAFQNFLQAFYGTHPYNHLALGLPGSLASVTREDLLTWHRTMLQPNRMVFAVVGDTSADEILELFSRTAPPTLFDPEPAITLPVPTLPTWNKMVEHVVTLEGQQTHIVWGFPTVTVHDQDRYALRLLDTILGGMGGRLFVELRDKKSLAYTVTTFDAYPVDRGFLALYVGCSPNKEAEAIGEFERILHDVQRDGVTSEELERAKTYLQGVLDIGLQSTSQRTAVYGVGELQIGRWDAFQEYLEAVRKMSAPEVQRVAQTYLNPSHSVRMILRAEQSSGAQTRT